MNSTIRSIGRLVGGIALVLMAACSKHDGSELVGKWEPADAKSDKAGFEIAKTGDAFVLINTNNGMRFPATYDAQAHQLKTTLPLLGTLPLAYDSSSEHLNFMGSDFRRVKDSGAVAANKAADTKAVDPKIAEAFAFGKSLMTPRMTVCDGRTFIMMSEGDGAAAPYIGEISKPVFHVNPSPIRTADQQNGIDFQGSVRLRFETFRVVHRGKWTSWFGPNDMLVGISVQGSESVYILHKNGQWMHDENYLGRHDFAGLKRKPIACEAVVNIATAN